MLASSFVLVHGLEPATFPRHHMPRTPGHMPSVQVCPSPEQDHKGLRQMHADSGI